MNANKRHYRRIEDYVRQIRELYFKTISQVVSASLRADIDKDKLFEFQDYPMLNNEVNRLVRELAKSINVVTLSGVKNEWYESAKVNDKLVQEMTKSITLPSSVIQKYSQRNLEALYAFQSQKVKGLNLSQRIWLNTSRFKGVLELALDVGIGEGTSAAQLSRNIRGYLIKPDKLFRRVRDKHGDLVLSKNARKYNPGSGMYRSSYKNATRLARTVINNAYRLSDYYRRQQLDFVVGIEIKRSNHVYDCPVCDSLKGKYPKEFIFTSWHPNCRCFSISILATREEFITQQKAYLETGVLTKIKSKNEINEVPANFKKWLKDNRERVIEAQSIGTEPWWMRDNASQIADILFI